MTFKQTASEVTLANRAIAMLSDSRTITSFADSGLHATVAKRWYKPVVARLLEMHHWGLATKRASLTEVTNGRSGEWLYAYGPPDDMAFPVGFTTLAGTSNISYYRGLAGLIAMTYGKPIFQHHNGVLYGNLTGDLEYVSYDITEGDFNATFEDIVVLMLASRMAREIPKDAGLADDLEQKANNAINLAIAQDLSAGGRQYGNFTSEAELARGTLYGSSWDYYPLPPGY